MVGRGLHANRPAGRDRELRCRHDLLHAAVVGPPIGGRQARAQVRGTRAQVEIPAEDHGGGRVAGARRRDGGAEQVGALCAGDRQAGVGQMRGAGDDPGVVQAQPDALLRVAAVLGRVDPAGRPRCRGAGRPPDDEADPVRLAVAASERATGPPVERRLEGRDNGGDDRGAAPLASACCRVVRSSRQTSFTVTRSGVTARITAAASRTDRPV